MTKPATSAQALDACADAYSDAFPYAREDKLTLRSLGERIAAHITDTGAKRVLSLGIGHMEIARSIAGLVSRGLVDRYVVVDASPMILSTFRNSITPVPPGLDVVEAFFETFEDPGQFDVIEAGFILEHVDDPAKVLRHMLRFVAPGGCMFAAVPNARSLHRLLGHEAGLLPDMYALSAADHALGHQRYFDVESLQLLAQACGWRVQATAGLLLKPFTTGQLERLALPDAVWAALQRVAAPYPEIANSFCVDLVPCG